MRAAYSGINYCSVKVCKKIFAKYWGKYTSMGDSFLDSVQGIKALKIFKADSAQHVKMNENAEEFRKITMKVLVMQLASTTIMDFVAYGGAGVGIAIAVADVVKRGLPPVEVFYAHTISTVCIAVIVSLAVFVFVGNVAGWYLALIALLGYITVGIVVPVISSGRLKESGVLYRLEFAAFNAYFLDSIEGIRDTGLIMEG